MYLLLLVIRLFAGLFAGLFRHGLRVVIGGTQVGAALVADARRYERNPIANLRTSEKIAGVIFVGLFLVTFLGAVLQMALS